MIFDHIFKSHDFVIETLELRNLDHTSAKHFILVEKPHSGSLTFTYSRIYWLNRLLKDRLHLDVVKQLILGVCNQNLILGPCIISERAEKDNKELDEVYEPHHEVNDCICNVVSEF